MGPRGPAVIDARTRDIVPVAYIGRVEGLDAPSIEFAAAGEVKVPGK